MSKINLTVEALDGITEYDISNKLFDYSVNTIKQLIRDGYDDTRKVIK